MNVFALQRSHTIFQILHETRMSHDIRQLSFTFGMENLPHLFSTGFVPQRLRRMKTVSVFIHTKNINRNRIMCNI